MNICPLLVLYWVKTNLVESVDETLILNITGVGP